MSESPDIKKPRGRPKGSGKYPPGKTSPQLGIRFSPEDIERIKKIAHPKPATWIHKIVMDKVHTVELVMAMHDGKCRQCQHLQSSDGVCTTLMCENYGIAPGGWVG